MLPRSKDGLMDTIVGFLASLLEAGVVDALLVPVEVPSGRGVAQTLIRDRSRLEGAVPISPVMPVNSATIVSNLTAEQREGKLGVVLRSCEIRALVELVKLKQASLENVVVIGVDCAGSYSVPDYAEMGASIHGGAKAGTFLDRALSDGAAFRWEGREQRPACRICERPVPELGDVRVGFLGSRPDEPLSVALSDEVVSARLERLGLLAGVVPGREKAVAALVEARTQARNSAFADVRAAAGSTDGLLDYFSACLTCHNCSVTCPICYCKQCVFTTSTFEHSPSQYMARAARKGALRMPADTMLYHLTRMNHMATSCVGCGQCESGCPSRVPLTVLFRSVAEQVQGLYEYVPGRSLEEEPPVTTFREDELKSVAR